MIEYFCLTRIIETQIYLTKFSNSLYFQAVPPIIDDDDGHLAYKLGDVIEHENHRCKYDVTNL